MKLMLSHRNASFRVCIIGIGLFMQLISYGQEKNSWGPLSIGDTVPDLTLQDVSGHGPSKTRLSDYSGKLVILDFWGRYCAPCIKALPKLDSLQRLFPDKVQVITISDFGNSDDVAKALSRHFKPNDFRLPVLTSSDTLSTYFPHSLVSHIIWIDGQRVLRSTSETDYVTAANIRVLLNGGQVNWPVKKDVMNLDWKKPLLGMEQKNIDSPAFLYYSTFTAYLEGIGLPNGTYKDEIKKTFTTTYYNHTLLALCQLAMGGYQTRVDGSQWVFHVRDSSRFTYINGEKKFYTAWAKQNTFCYSLQLPGTMLEEERKEYLRKDLLRWLNLMGVYVRKETRKVKGKAINIYIITEQG